MTDPAALAELHDDLLNLREDVSFIALHMRRFAEIVADSKDICERSEKLLRRIDATVDKLIEVQRNTPTLRSPAPEADDGG